MATVTGFTAARMLEIEAAAIVNGAVDLAGDLNLTTHGGTVINAGNVKGAKGDAGIDAAPGSVAVVGDTTPIRTSDGRVKAATPTATDDVSTKSYTDSGNASDRAYTDTKDVSARAYTDTKDVSARAYTDTKDVDARAYTNGFQYPIYAIQGGTSIIATAVLTNLGLAAAPLTSANGYTRAAYTVAVPVQGTYLVTYRFRYTNGTVGAGRAFTELTVSAVSEYLYTIANDITTFGRTPTGPEDNGVITAMVSLKAGALVGVRAFQSSGANRAIDGVLQIKRVY